ncbi:Alpha carbonic anhydrase 4 [Vitis vinifera]|uniref:Carbonic anhydrase n=1 Tax=Vitis vinifera TaxID=29760 RepID=A0A438JL25_VITVI|nr:Alpha carbonic anhydrase 4 [Vitis vinifera]
MHTTTPNFLFLILFSLLLSSLFTIATSSESETEDETQFSYIEDTGKGPKRWGQINPDWKACGNGAMQSPIDLLDARVQVLPNLEKLKRDYKPAPAVVKNRGHDVTVEWKGYAGKININGTYFKLQQCHWHSPSEHTFNGSRYNLELHVIHLSSDEKIAVIGITYKYGRADPFLTRMLRHIDSLPVGEEKELGLLTRVILSSGAESTIDILVLSQFLHVRTATREQVRALRKAVQDASFYKSCFLAPTWCYNLRGWGVEMDTTRNTMDMRQMQGQVRKWMEEQFCCINQVCVESSNRNFTFLFRISLLLFSLLILCTSITIADEVEDESEFSYIEGSETGPEKWGTIKAEWKTCGKGKRQSPIDLRNRRVSIFPDFGQLKRKYRPAHAVLKNRGHDVAVEWKGNAGKIKLHGVHFKLEQLHWHTPSEHTVNGTSFQMELHLVHKSARGKIAVIGKTFKLGPPDPFLAKMIDHVTGIPAGEEKDIGIVDANDIKHWGRKYYRYIGSLTTPPCTEGVIWTISKKVNTVSKEQVESLRRVVHDGHEGNARPAQRLNGRPVWLYIPFQMGRPSN